jgi:hypothetical protein
MRRTIANKVRQSRVALQEVALCNYNTGLIVHSLRFNCWPECLMLIAGMLNIETVMKVGWWSSRLSSQGEPTAPSHIKERFTNNQNLLQTYELGTKLQKYEYV